MEEILDPEVLAVVRRINDRFLRLGKPTSKHEVRVNLRGKRFILDKLEEGGVLRTANNGYVPRLKAFGYSDPTAVRAALDSTDLVLHALKRLYELDGLGKYTIQQVEQASQAGRETVRIGLLMVLEFREYYSSYSISRDGMVTSVTVNEEIIDFESIDATLREEEDRRKVQAGDATNMPATPETPAANQDPVEPYGRWEQLERLSSGGQGIVYLVRDVSQFNASGVLQDIATSLMTFPDILEPH